LDEDAIWGFPVDPKTGIIHAFDKEQFCLGRIVSNAPSGVQELDFGLACFNLALKFFLPTR